MARVSVIYWDTSAILSVLFQDDRSDAALKRARATSTHLVSSLAWAETHAVIARLERERSVSRVLAAAAHDVLEQGAWRRVNAVPAWESIASLAQKWPLRGADLWHLATAMTLRDALPELTLLSYDARLAAAAAGEGMAAA